MLEVESQKKAFSLLENNFNNTLLQIKSNTDKLYEIDKRLIRNEQYINRESLIISGIPEYISQNVLEEKVLEILHSIGLHNVSHYDIAACHRLKKIGDNRFPARTIVRFTNRKIPIYCIKNRKLLLNQRNKLKMNLRSLSAFVQVMKKF